MVKKNESKQLKTTNPVQTNSIINNPTEEETVGRLSTSIFTYAFKFFKG